MCHTILKLWFDPMTESILEQLWDRKEIIETVDRD
jgi:hypothetical protein